MHFFEKLKPASLLVMRLAIGVVFIGHGYEKLSDIPHFLQAFPGYGFPSYFAYIAGYMEVIGGVLLILGLFTRYISLVLAIEMAMVLSRTLLPQSGLFGYKIYQVALLLGAGALGLVAMGAGEISVDAYTLESGRKSTEK